MLAVGRLGPHDLLIVLTELLHVCAVWYNIGLVLYMSPGTLDGIHVKGPYKTPMDCLREMLKVWLSTSPDPSWEELIAALKDPIVGEPSLARQLEAKYLTQGESESPIGN